MSAALSRWRLATLADVARLEMGQSPDGEATNADGKGMPLIGGAADYNDGQIKASRYTTEVTKACRRGDLIICIRATIGKVAVADKVYCLGRGVAGLRPSKVNPDFLRYFLNSQAKAMDEAGTGTTFRQIDKKTLSSWPIPLPESEEQGRVVAKLSKLLGRSKIAREELARIPRIVERYKQAVLAAAFEGRLTYDWRRNHNQTQRVWKQKLLGDVSIDIRYGTAMKCHYEPKKTPVLRIPNIVSGQVDLADLKFGSFTASEREKLALKKGDLLVIRSNGSLDLVGRTALVSSKAEGFLYAGYLIRIRLDPKQVRPEFVSHAFSEPSIRAYIETLAKSTSGVNNINSQQLRAIELRVPPLDEQKIIVEKIEAAFSAIDAMREHAIRATDLLNRLDQATLIKAFDGELVT